MSDPTIESIAKAAEKISKENDRRSRMTHIIDELLEERQKLLVCFYEIVALEEGNSAVDDIISKLKELNQWLVDYSALGHFEIYNRIIEGNERRHSVVKIAEQVYGDIEKSTKIFVDFNDKYEGADSVDSLTSLSADLSLVGEHMALRVDAEDKLLVVLKK